MTTLELIAFSIMGLALLLVLLRLLMGPNAADRIVAADTLAMITTVSVSGFALWFNNAIYLDIALIYSTLAFVGIVALARAIEGNRS